MSQQSVRPAQHHSQATTDPFHYVHDLVLRFINGIDRRPVAASELVAIEQMLEFVPLDSHEFGLAGTRLGNARRYMNCGEFGAAKYELRLLLSVLAPRRIAEPIRPVCHELHQ